MAESRPYLPEIWADDTQMTVLFSPFRDKSLNPKSWEQKEKFWTKMIVQECRHCGEAIIDIKTISSRFLRNGKIPSGLDVVVQEMTRSGRLKKLEDMLKMNTSRSNWLSWGYNQLVKAPLSWGWKYLSGNQTEPIEGQYVLAELIQEKAQLLLEAHYNEVICDITDNIVVYAELREHHMEMCKTDCEFSLVIQLLESDKKIALHTAAKNEVLVKFPAKKDTVTPVQENDLHVYRIKRAQNLLKERIEKLSAVIEKYTLEAKQYLNKGLKTSALHSVRCRKRVRMRVDKLTGSLDMLEDILNRIRGAVSDEMVVKAIEAGTKGLKELTGRMGIDSVTSTMDQLTEALEEQDEISAEISMTSSRLEDVYQEDLETELDRILQEGGETTDPLNELTSAFQDMELPDVPTFSPGKANTSEHDEPKEKYPVQLAS